MDHLRTVSDCMGALKGGFRSYGGHGFDSTGRMLPVDPNGVESERCNEPGGGNGTQSEVHTNERWDLAIVGVTDRLTDMMGLEE